MKKLILLIMFFFSIIITANVSASNSGMKDFNSSSKEEAINFIKKSLSDPQISEWVKNKFYSENLFMMAVKLAPENTVKEIATSFTDFQKIGGEAAPQAFYWILLILLIVVSSVAMASV